MRGVYIFNNKSDRRQSSFSLSRPRERARVFGFPSIPPSAFIVLEINANASCHGLTRGRRTLRSAGRPDIELHTLRAPVSCLFRYVAFENGTSAPIFVPGPVRTHPVGRSLRFLRLHKSRLFFFLGGGRVGETVAFSTENKQSRHVPGLFMETFAFEPVVYCRLYCCASSVVPSYRRKRRKIADRHIHVVRPTAVAAPTYPAV